MKKALLALSVSGLLLSAGVSYGGVSVGAKLWNVNVDGYDSALMYGATASLDLGESGFWMSAMYLTGELESEYADYDYIERNEVETTDTEAVLGYRIGILDIGAGVRYATWEFTDTYEQYGITYKQTIEVVHYGPMAYVGAGNTFGDSPLGWYVSGSYMFLDLGDLYDEEGVDEYGNPEEAETLEHWNAEGGLFLAWESLSATVGYRYKEYVNYDDITFDGVAGSVSLRF